MSILDLQSKHSNVQQSQFVCLNNHFSAIIFVLSVSQTLDSGGAHPSSHNELISRLIFRNMVTIVRSHSLQIIILESLFGTLSALII